MGLIRTEALVLRAIDFSESTQIAHFFSPGLGKFAAMARGVKRLKSRMGPRLEVMARVEVAAYMREGASMGSLSSIELLRRWSVMQRELKTYALAALVIESIDRGMEEGKAAPEVYRLALGYLQQLEDGGDADTLTAHALLRLICLLGFAPDAREAAVAPGITELYFHPEEGRFQALPPEDLRLPRLRLGCEQRQWLRQSMSLPIGEFAAEKLPAAQARPLLTFLLELMQYDLEVELKSARFLRKMIWK